VNYGAAGLAAADGLSAALGAAIAALAASAGAAADAAGAAADAADSGAGAGSSDLLQAVAKNIETSARSRTLRIAFSLVGRCSLERGKLETGQEYDRRGLTSSAGFCGLSDNLFARVIRARACKNFFDYFAGICMIRSIFGALGADEVEVVGWKSGALFSRALGPQIGTTLESSSMNSTWCETRSVRSRVCGRSREFSTG